MVAQKRMVRRAVARGLYGVSAKRSRCTIELQAYYGRVAQVDRASAF